MKKFRAEQLQGNYGDLCQRECNMKVTMTRNSDVREKSLKNSRRALIL